MLRQTLILSLVVSSFGTLAGTAGAEEDGARAVLRQVVKDMGGDTALAAVRGMRSTYDGTYGGMPYRSTFLWSRPGRMLMHVDARPAFEGKMALDGDVAWSSFGAPVARIRGAAREALGDWQDHIEMMLVRPVLERDDVKIESGAGAADARGRIERVLLTHPDGKKYDMTIRITGDTARLVRVTGDMLHMDGRAGTFRWDLAEHAWFGSIVLPTKLRMRTFVGDEEVEDMTETVTSVEWNPPIAKGAFAMPALGLPIGKPELREVEPMSGLVRVHRGAADGLRDTITGLYALAQKHGLMISGPVAITAIESEDEEQELLEVLLPVMVMGAPPADLPEDVRVGLRKGGRVATVRTRGEYGTADVAGIEKLAAWMEEKGHEAAGPLTIVYHHDPAATVPADQVAEVRVPVK